MTKKFKISKNTKLDLAKGKGTKDDAGKAPLSLIDPYFIEALAFHMQKGAIKYKRGNWQLDLDPEKILNAEKRHSNQIQKNQVIDEETGSHHSIAIAANAMMLYFYERHNKSVKTEHDKG